MIKLADQNIKDVRLGGAEVKRVLQDGVKIWERLSLPLMYSIPLNSTEGLACIITGVAPTVSGSGVSFVTPVAGRPTGCKVLSSYTLLTWAMQKPFENVTFSYWVYPDATYGGHNTSWRIGGSTDDLRYPLKVAETEGGVRRYGFFGYPSAFSGGKYATMGAPPGVWSLTTWSIEWLTPTNATVRVYSNGVLIYTYLNCGISNVYGTYMYLGQREGNGCTNFTFSSLKLYNALLSDAQIAAQFENEKASYL